MVVPLGGRGRGGDTELGPPLTEHLVDLLFEDSGVGRVALLADGQETRDDLLEVINTRVFCDR